MKLIVRIALSSLLAAAALPAVAALGGDAASVQSDGASLKSAVRVTASAGYAVHEMASPAGIVVREFVGTDGRVFAVSWHGIGNPDLRQVLGSYYARYEQGSALALHSSHRQLVISLADFRFENAGRQRGGFAGRAWVPAMLPATFSTDDLK
ncbi:MAG: DUF2844 domain-containing protein [Proteobacteria bacterium]|nr:DUF2844 domain-containing protein [Pseudomonadota bacterium]